MAFLDDSRLSLTPWSFRTRVSFLSAQLRHKILVKKQSLEISFPSIDTRLKQVFVFYRPPEVVNFRLKSLLETTFAQRKQICSFDDGDTHTRSIGLVGVESGHSVIEVKDSQWNLKPQMRVTPPPIFGAKCKWKPCKRDKSTSRDFVARGRPLRGQKRLAPLAKRSTCIKSSLDVTNSHINWIPVRQQDFGSTKNSLQISRIGSLSAEPECICLCGFS